MPHVHRFYISADGIHNNTRATLSDQEAHHALHVVRLRVGDSAALFDGAGREWQAVVESAARHTVELRITEAREISQPTACVTLYQASLHREKAVEELVRHAAELGVARVVFFRSEHSGRAPKLSDKWRRIAIEACKQSGRLWLPHFDVAASLDEAIAMAGGVRLVATRDIPPVPLRTALTAREVSVFIGPEGDFSATELEQLLAANAIPISLGEATYRAEVAATLAVAFIGYELEM
ncbi:MAG: RsmE family RNA methyltransferase [Candidatus Hydrogenedentes bacterium]|nr:RsmE family RNA methyltransferase [Candidatus Hydrogenedentota bacterium]